MARRKSRPGRSRQEWAIRGVSAMLLLGAAYVSLTQTSAAIVNKQNPVLASRLDPGNARIMAAAAEKSFIEKPDARSSSLAARRARDAVMRDPTAVQAIATLGLQAHMRGDLATARRAFAYSQKLSRRHLQTQLWAIEDAVSRDDVPSALQHYDIALRTSRFAPDLLFPVLTSAVADDTVRTALTKTLVRKPAWAEAFVNHVSGRGDPIAVVRLLTDLSRAGFPVPAEGEKGLINTLIASLQFEEAWRFYSFVRGISNRNASRDPRFGATLALPSLLDWTTNDGAISATIQRGLVFSAPPSVGGSILQQVQLLRPGPYVLLGHSLDIDQSESASPYWVLICQLDGRELGRVPVPNSAVDRGRFSGRINVPVGCPAQVLTLIARPSSSASGLVGQIDYLQLRPAS